MRVAERGVSEPGGKDEGGISGGCGVPARCVVEAVSGCELVSLPLPERENSAEGSEEDGACDSVEVEGRGSCDSMDSDVATFAPAGAEEEAAGASLENRR